MMKTLEKRDYVQCSVFFPLRSGRTLQPIQITPKHSFITCGTEEPGHQNQTEMLNLPMCRSLPAESKR